MSMYRQLEEAGECCNMSCVINGSVICLVHKMQWLWIGAIEEHRQVL